MTNPIPADLERLRADVDRARGRCDFLLISVHWGLPGTEICDYQREIAHAAIDAGADIVFGHGPHSVHGIKMYRGRPVLYSLGNLAFDWTPMRGRHRDGIVASCHLDEAGQVRKITLRATRRDEDNNVQLLDLNDRSVLEHVRELSPHARSRLSYSAEGLVLACGEDPAW